MRATLMQAAVVLGLLALGGCKRLPDPDADEVSRVLRYVDAAQRPGGGDVPLERYFAWAARRDAGAASPDDLTAELRALVDQQEALLRRIRRIVTHSDVARSVLDAYAGAHVEGMESLRAALDARRGQSAEARRHADADEGVRRALAELRGARALRREVVGRLDLPAGQRGAEPIEGDQG